MTPAIDDLSRGQSRLSECRLAVPHQHRVEGREQLGADHSVVEQRALGFRGEEQPVAASQPCGLVLLCWCR